MTIVSTIKNSIALFLLLSLTFSCASKKSLNREEQEHTSTELPDRFSDSTVFQSFSLDFNHDGRMDIVYAHQALNSDSLFVFEKTANGFDLSLATLNLTEDGLFFIDRVEAVPDHTGLTLQTIFNGAGALKQTYYFELNKTSWILKQTMTESSMNDENRSIEYCTIIQNLELSKHTDWTKLRDRNEAQPGECFIK